MRSFVIFILLATLDIYAFAPARPGIQEQSWSENAKVELSPQVGGHRSNRFAESATREENLPENVLLSVITQDSSKTLRIHLKRGKKATAKVPASRCEYEGTVEGFDGSFARLILCQKPHGKISFTNGDWAVLQHSNSLHEFGYKLDFFGKSELLNSIRLQRRGTDASNANNVKGVRIALGIDSDIKALLGSKFDATLEIFMKAINSIFEKSTLDARPYRLRFIFSTVIIYKSPFFDKNVSRNFRINGYNSDSNAVNYWAHFWGRIDKKANVGVLVTLGTNFFSNNSISHPKHVCAEHSQHGKFVMPSAIVKGLLSPGTVVALYREVLHTLGIVEDNSSALCRDLPSIMSSMNMSNKLSQCDLKQVDRAVFDEKAMGCLSNIDENYVPEVPSIQLVQGHGSAVERLPIDYGKKVYSQNDLKFNAESFNSNDYFISWAQDYEGRIRNACGYPWEYKLKPDHHCNKVRQEEVEKSEDLKEKTFVPDIESSAENPANQGQREENTSRAPSAKVQISTENKMESLTQQEKNFSKAPGNDFGIETDTIEPDDSISDTEVQFFNDKTLAGRKWSSNVLDIVNRSDVQLYIRSLVVRALDAERRRQQGTVDKLCAKMQSRGLQKTSFTPKGEELQLNTFWKPKKSASND